MVKDKSLLRILDANFNRTKEGLRVCEDVCRYAWDDQALTRQYKQVRHAVTVIFNTLDIKGLISARSIQQDVGKGSIDAEARRRDLKVIFWANSQRVKESLRVLEEVVKLMSAPMAGQLKKLRYKVYALEQKAVARG